MNDNHRFGVDPVTRLLLLPLTALRAIPAPAPIIIGDMPGNTLLVRSAVLFLAATRKERPFYGDAIERLACDRRADVMLVRSGPRPETFDAVSVDVALRYQRRALVVTGMMFFRHVDRGLWLLPAGSGPFVELTPLGLRLEMLPPFLDADERSDGLCRAARDIVLLSRREG